MFREVCRSVFDHVELVDVLDSKDETNLALLERPDLGVTFTKLHCWRLTQYRKAVFMDADTLVSISVVYVYYILINSYILPAQVYRCTSFCYFYIFWFCYILTIQAFCILVLSYLKFRLEAMISRLNVFVIVEINQVAIVLSYYF